MALLLLLLLCLRSTAQNGYWQQKVDVSIDVQLNDTAKSLNGFETLIYTNNAPDTLFYIWFHVWPNAYKNDRTAFSDQLLALGNTDFYFAQKTQRGYINRLAFKVNGIIAKTEDHPEHIDIVKVVLPTPLPPHTECTITTPIHVKLPALFSRSGYNQNAFQVTQWYPKPAVYDAQGWHPMPYLEQGEFYGEFGSYNVSLTVPAHYVVAASGTLQEETEITWMQHHTPPAAPPKKKGTYGHLKKLPASKKEVPDSNFFKPPYRTKTLHFKQENSHDFAWIANKNFHVATDTCLLPSGKIVNVYSYYLDRPNSLWLQSVTFAKKALRFYATEIGDYPYETVHVAESTGTPGGMEYPGLTLIGPTASIQTLDALIAHEIGHNWFYGALGSNERDAPWLDEGLNTYYEKKYMAQQYGTATDHDDLLFHELVTEQKDQPITTSSAAFSDINYNLVAYNKAATWLALVEQKLGVPLFQNTMQAYYQQWQFKHPQPHDFKNHIAKVLPDTSVFALLDTTGALPNQQLSGWRVLSPVVPKTINRQLWQSAKNTILISPALGYNNYDKRMLGGFVTNYGFPAARLQYLAIPMYATGSKTWNGIGELKYKWFPRVTFHKLEVGVTGMGFSKRYLPDSNGTAQYERFLKVAPFVRSTRKEAPGSTRQRSLEWKTFFIREKNFSHFVVKASDGLLYVDSSKKHSYYVNQLSYSVADFRALYPYSYQVQLQQGSSFYRINLTGNYFFNYSSGGGVQARLFFAKFGYLTKQSSERFAATRFQPKLLGTTGDEDYTYSSYFLGRTASFANDGRVVQNSGLAAQQIALRDGAFKWRLDPFEFLQGRSENWVAALNLTTTLPRSIVPKFLPLKLFFDLGTFAEAAKQEATTQRILYLGGLQLSVLHNALNVYAPLIYSADFRNNLKSVPEQNTFLKRLTFSIDLGQLSLQRLTRNKFSL